MVEDTLSEQHALLDQAGSTLRLYYARSYFSFDPGYDMEGPPTKVYLAEAVEAAFARLRERASFPPQRSDPATWVLHLLAEEEISISKAREWLRHYIQDGVQDSLPDVQALP